MIDDGRSQSRRRRRAVLPGPAAALAIAALAAGMGEFGRLPFAASQAYAAGDQWHAPASFAPLVDRIKAAVVAVHVKSTRSGGATEQVPPVPRNSPFRRFFEQPDQDEVVSGEGSGFFISPDGYIVTNNHVAGHAKTVEVTTADGDIHAAKVVGTDERSDLALIKIDAGRRSAYVKFADRPPQVGDWVVAPGHHLILIRLFEETVEPRAAWDGQNPLGGTAAAALMRSTRGAKPAGRCHWPPAA